MKFFIGYVLHHIIAIKVFYDILCTSHVYHQPNAKGRFVYALYGIFPFSAPVMYSFGQIGNQELYEALYNYIFHHLIAIKFF